MTFYSFDQMSGAPRTWRFAGRDWPVSGLTMYQLGQLEAYLKDSVPSPLAEFRALVKDDGFTPDERAELFRDARAQMEPQYGEDGLQTGGWPPSFHSARGQQVLLHGCGVGYFLWVILAKHTPTLRPEEAEELAPLLEAENLRDLMDRIQAPSGDEPPVSSDSADLPPGYVDPKG